MAEAATPARSPLFAFADRYVEEHAARDPLLATIARRRGLRPPAPQVLDRALHGATPTSPRRRSRRCAPSSPSTTSTGSPRPSWTSACPTPPSWSAPASTPARFGTIVSPVSEHPAGLRAHARARPPRMRAVIAARLRAVRPALASWREGLADVAARGELPPAATCSASPSRPRPTRAARSRRSPTACMSPPAPDDLTRGGPRRRRRLRRARGPPARGARSARDRRWRRAGRSGTRKWLRHYNGIDARPRRALRMGLGRPPSHQRRGCGSWPPSSHRARSRLADVAATLDGDDARAIFGTDALLERLEAFTRATVDQLDGVHFDIDERVRRCDARLAPEGSAAAPYYIAPSEDLTRPGTTWFPTLGRTRFPWWRSVSTWYHEAVPGHHLQDATIAPRERPADAVPAHVGVDERLRRGVGAVRRAADGGARRVRRPRRRARLPRGPGLRAARIVVDLGLHLGLRRAR